MKQILSLRALCFSITLFLTLTTYAGPFSRYANKVINASIPESSTGIVVLNAKTGRTLFKQNADHAYIPASNAKLFTAIAALKQLGNTYRFTTSLIASQRQIRQNRLSGNLYVKFTGDPTLTTAELSSLFKTLRQKGVRQITGNVILDTNTFSGATIPLGWSHDDLAYCFAAPVESVILNQNCMHISVNMNSKNEMYIKRNKDAKGFRIINNLNQIPGKGDPKTCVFAPSVSNNNVVTLNGCQRAKRNWNFNIAIANPDLFAKRIVTNSLKQNKIRLNGHITFGSTPKNTTVIAQVKSPTMASLVDTMLTYSNNIYAGALTRAIGKSYFSVGSNKAGVNAIEAITAKMIGRPYKHLILEDGAGGSRYNLVTPLELAQLLRAAYKNTRIRSVLYDALPRSGYRGTLSYRMNKKPLLGRVYAKTGSMSGVTSLSGYIKNKYGRILIFSIVSNGLTQPLGAGRRVQDRLVSRMYRTL